MCEGVGGCVMGIQCMHKRLINIAIKCVPYTIQGIPSINTHQHLHHTHPLHNNTYITHTLYTTTLYTPSTPQHLLQVKNMSGRMWYHVAQSNVWCCWVRAISQTNPLQPSFTVMNMIFYMNGSFTWVLRCVVVCVCVSVEHNKYKYRKIYR